MTERKVTRLNDPLISAKLKLKRANGEIRRIDQLIDSFLTSKPYRFTDQSCSDGIHISRKVWFDPIPPGIMDSVGTSCSFMRSALDKLACALARQQDNTASIRSVSFPISDSEEEFLTTRMQRKIAKLSPKALRAIQQLRPYQGGDNVLWAMNKLRQSDIHHDLLVPIGSQITSFYMGPMTLEPGPGQTALFKGPKFRLDGQMADALEDGADLITMPAANFNQLPTIEISVCVCVRGIPFIGNDDVRRVLRRFEYRTSEILESFEKDFFS